MNKELLALSFSLKKRRRRAIARTAALVVCAVAATACARTFLVFSICQKSASMSESVPPSARVFFTPIVGRLSRGDVALLKPLSAEKPGARFAAADAAVRFFTAQRVSLLDMDNLMGSRQTMRRIVALPGDTIYMRGNVLFVKPKGAAHFLTEYEVAEKPYTALIAAQPPSWDPSIGTSPDFGEITLGDDEYFALGDSRNSCADSRLWGPVRSSGVQAKALAIFFPLSKIRAL